LVLLLLLLKPPLYLSTPVAARFWILLHAKSGSLTFSQM
jgi:hypothetical protein